MKISGLDKQHAMLMAATDKKLSGAAKAVLCVLIDHYNLNTRLCCPSIALIAIETGLVDRSVRRALKCLQLADWLDWVRHGGTHHTNLYKINWRKYAIAWDEYQERRTRHRINNTDTTGLNSSDRERGPSCPEYPDSVVPQTREVIREIIPESVQSASSTTSADIGAWGQRQFARNRSLTAPVALQERERVESDEHHDQHGSRAKAFRQRQTSSAEAASLCAKQRWRKDFNGYFRGTDYYASALAALTREIEEAATEAELKERGQGIVIILEKLNDARRI